MKRVRTLDNANRTSIAFTIIELMIVIVVIAILAAVTIVAYNGISNKAKESALKADVENGAKQLLNARTTAGAYPTDTTDIKKSNTTNFTYVYNNVANTFCLQASSSTLSGKTFYITQAGVLTEGECPAAPIADGSFIQTITSANCPSTMTRAVDARDNRTYWVQKLDDGKCWMLTNLAYAGGGTNAYGDTKTLTNGTGGSTTYTVSSYYIPTSGSNVTAEPNLPSVLTTGAGQYGYLYNWCGAMGGQATAACAEATTPAPNIAVSICPAGWRLPIGNDGDFATLNTAINGGLTGTDIGLLTSWLAQRSGEWTGNFSVQGSAISYWSSTQNSSTFAYRLYFYGILYLQSYTYKYTGSAVRCVAN